MSNSTDQPEELADASKYMRTYAKDMAALSKAQGTKTTPPPVEEPKPVPVVASTTTQTTDGVTLPDVDESLITQDRLTKTGDEPIDISDGGTGESVSVFEQQKKVETPIQPPPPPPAPERPKPLAPVSTMSMAPSASSTRADILARLKARAQQRAQAPIPVAVLTPVVEAPEPVPPPPPVPVAPPPQKAKAPEPFHSYTTDFADRIDTKGASTFSVLAAQSDAAPRTVVRTRRPSRRSMQPATMLAVLFVVLGVGVASFGIIFFLTRPDTVTITQGVPSLIEADETKKLEGVSGTELLLALKQVADEPLVSGNVLVTYTTSASSTTKGLAIELPQEGGALVKALALQAPDILLRNIRNESTVGVVHAGSETRPFFILRVSSFERTFAGMLAWEGVMRSSLSLLYPAYPNVVVPESEITGTSTATTTIVAPPPRPAPMSFVDAVVRNYDVRMLRDSSGRSLMLYGYKDKETLIIARDEAAFLELVSRLNASGK